MYDFFQWNPFIECGKFARLYYIYECVPTVAYIYNTMHRHRCDRHNIIIYFFFEPRKTKTYFHLKHSRSLWLLIISQWRSQEGCWVFETSYEIDIIPLIINVLFKSMKTVKTCRFNLYLGLSPSFQNPAGYATLYILIYYIWWFTISQ